MSQEIDQRDSGTLTMVQTVQPTDLESMQRLQVVQPSLQRLLNPSVNAFYQDEELTGFSSPETRFFDQWERWPDAVMPESVVRVFTKRHYARHAYLAEWFPRLPAGQVPDCALCQSPSWPAREYYTDGLGALAELFADETYDAINFRPVEDFVDVIHKYGYPANTFKPGDIVCSFRDWRKGVVLAMLRFGKISQDALSVKEALSEYSSDLDFIERYVKEAHRVGSRLNLPTFHQFAKAWDVAILPLRFFTCEAALGFVREWYAYGSNDLKRFRTIFYNGGGNQTQLLKHGRGLKLTRAQPAIIDKWSENGIRLNATAAAWHGYNAGVLKQVLGERYKRLISVRP